MSLSVASRGSCYSCLALWLSSLRIKVISSRTETRRQRQQLSTDVTFYSYILCQDDTEVNVNVPQYSSCPTVIICKRLFPLANHHHTPFNVMHLYLRPMFASVAPVSLPRPVATIYATATMAPHALFLIILCERLLLPVNSLSTPVPHFHKHYLCHRFISSSYSFTPCFHNNTPTPQIAVPQLLYLLQRLLPSACFISFSTALFLCTSFFFFFFFQCIKFCRPDF